MAATKILVIIGSGNGLLLEPLNLGAISKEILKIYNPAISLEMTNLRLLQYLPGANKLTLCPGTNITSF